MSIRALLLITLLAFPLVAFLGGCYQSRPLPQDESFQNYMNNQDEVNDKTEKETTTNALVNIKF